ncbi:MAG TPA: trehalose-6-phosphate synthase [Candidatus Limnocylindrales bacterium]|nr:trehalose-6-phosphate synthase [Candidatus Limnocylindrales bacterium]
MPDDRAALLRDLLGLDGRLVVVSNRGPITFEHEPDEPGGLSAARGPGGLVTALAELGRHAPLTWVAAALTDADREVAPHLDPASTSAEGGRARELVSAILPGQDVRLVYAPVPEDVYERQYGVVANPFLWFLQHEMYATAYAPNVDEALLDAWRTGYRPFNLRLADAAVAAVDGARRPVILVQDYHLYLAPERIRERLPEATILHFTHIPWPADSQWQLIPQAMRRPICEGLLASDIVGFQTDRYASHFLDSVASFVRDARVDRDSRNVAWRGRRIRVRTYPISVDPDGLRAFADSDAVGQPRARLAERVQRAGSPRLIVRADRIEPSKNALRGFLAFEALLERRPELRRSVRFVAVQAPTRAAIAEYVEYATAVREVVARINRSAEPDDQPIWIYDGSDYGMAIAALRLADVVVVNPIVDGMNLVAKEAVLVGERDPVLVLSETAGAAEQLAAHSVSIAPADVAGTAAAIERALDMGVEERRVRLRRMRASVRQEDLDWWLGRQLRDLAAVRQGQVPPSRRLRDSVRRVEEASV